MVLKRGVERGRLLHGRRRRAASRADSRPLRDGDRRICAFIIGTTAAARSFVEVAAVAIHPGFRADALTKRAVSIDLALIQTQAPLDARFSAAQLDETGAVAVGQPLRIVGYGARTRGRGHERRRSSQRPLQVRAPLSTILALGRGSEQGAARARCSGDSGGPILSGDGAKVLAITTWSAGAGRGKRCGAVTQGPLVAPQRGWIDSVLQQMARLGSADQQRESLPCN